MFVLTSNNFTLGQGFVLPWEYNRSWLGSKQYTSFWFSKKAPFWDCRMLWYVEYCRNISFKCIKITKNVLRVMVVARPKISMVHAPLGKTKRRIYLCLFAARIISVATIFTRNFNHQETLVPKGYNKSFRKQQAL